MTHRPTAAMILPCHPQPPQRAEGARGHDELRIGRTEKEQSMEGNMSGLNEQASETLVRLPDKPPRLNA
ncbi:unnamed protein product [Protopolystoma xenopodis]|uniref:Uncharacterized protein n=1 Tax=Protopolystoma xenopodis TaxID=117903 RepID=A0A3S5A2J9_9PLAT|nr:unnamed protein product [Protopolystoma xenopodis]